MKQATSPVRWMLVALFVLESVGVSSANGAKPSVEIEQAGVDKVFYVAQGTIFFKEFKNGAILVANDSKTLARDLKFGIVGEVSVDTTTHKITTTNGELYYIIRIYPINKDADPLKGDSTFINSDDNAKRFGITKKDFEQAIVDGLIAKRYQTIVGSGCFSRVMDYITYGASLSLPFKFRPRIEDKNSTYHRNREIATNVSLGGYIGGRFRISSNKSYYFVPILSAGLSLIPLSDDATTKDDAPGTNTVPGLTLAAGLIFDLNQFQIGFVTGRDYASGTQGGSWVYNTRGWYSLSIGFSFFGKTDDK